MGQFRWRTFHMACAIVAVVTVAYWLWNPPIYLTNDDVTIRLALEGLTVPGQLPTGFTLFTHSALGWVLVGVQRLLPAVPWWDVVVATLLLWALGVLFALTWNVLGTDWLGRAMAVCSLLILVVPLVSGLQYTISATLAGGAAALLAVTELGALPRMRPSVLVMSVLLLMAGLFVRPMAAMFGALAVSLFLAPFVLASRSRIMLLLGAVGTAIVLFVAVQYFDGLLYTMSGEWDEYYRYNLIVARLFEWGGELSAQDVEAIRASVEWSTNDWSMMQRWWGVDNVIHGFERVAAAYEARAAIGGWDELLRSAFGRLSVDGVDRLRNIFSASTTVTIVVGTIAAVYASHRAALATAVALIVFCGFCLAVETIFKELPFRLLGPIVVCLVAVTLIAVEAVRTEPSPLLRVLGLGIILAILVPQMAATLAMSADRHRLSQKVEGEVAELRRLTPSLLVFHADSFPSEYWWRPFHRPPVELRAIALGRNNQHPFMQRFLTETGRQPLPRAICRDPSILLVADEGRLDFATTYLREHFNMLVAWTQVYSGSFDVWRCSVPR